MTHPELADCAKSMYLSNVLVISLCVYSFVFCICLCCTYVFYCSSGREERLMPITKRIIINQSINYHLVAR